METIDSTYCFDPKPGLSVKVFTGWKDARVFKDNGIIKDIIMSDRSGVFATVEFVNDQGSAFTENHWIFASEQV